MTSKTVKTITLQRLTLENFKGIHSLVLDFGGRSAAIYGDNAAGKTTVFDAWTWLLTGKDSLGRVAADNGGFDIKPLDRDGNVLDRSARSVVEGVLSVDGREITLRREYYEKWTEKRGRYEASYDGNSTDYYIDEVPKSKRQYDETVASLVPDKLLRLLSDVAAFPKLKWQDRRGILFDLAQVGEDREIMAREARFAPLAAATEGISLEDYQKQIKAQRQKENKERESIPPRLDELKRTEEDLSGLPFAQLRQSAADLEREQQKLLTGLNAAQGDELCRLENEANRLRNDLDRLELENQRYRADQITRNPRPEQLQSEITRLKLAYRYESDRYHNAKRDVERAEKEVAGCRSRWAEERGRRYPGSAICPTCGQDLPPEKQEEAHKCWEEDRSNRLERIQQDGNRYKTLLERAEQQMEAQKQAMIEWEGKIAQKQEELDALEAAGPRQVLDLDGYAAHKAGLTARIEEAETALAAARRDADAHGQTLRRRKAAVDQELHAIREQLAKEDILRYTRSRRDELAQKARELSGRLAQCDKMLDLCDQFTRFKADYITDGINRRFRLARFRLFNQQVNGGLNPCCDILCGGVPYDSGLNNGARINVGLDIIDTLSRHYGIRVPVFVDNAESVTAIPALENQMIRLVVSEADKKVRMER